MINKRKVLTRMYIFIISAIKYLTQKLQQSLKYGPMPSLKYGPI